MLYDSLCECAKDFKLYVLCMDDKCFDVLSDLKQEHHIPVRLADFEAGDDALLTAKGNRSMGEYCWTCSSSFIRYVLNHYGEDSCTYIDADMYFYNDPQVLIEEMIREGKSVMVVPHRFPDEKKELAKKVGTYCVEFNTFMNTAESLEVLEYWRGRCMECCSNLGDGIHWGDQKYLDELVEKFDCVHVCENNGAGVAPWNIGLYKSVNDRKAVFFVPCQKEVDMFFYHYQSIVYISKYVADIGLKGSYDHGFIELLYKPYLCKIQNAKDIVANKYGIYALIKGHPAMKNKFGWLKNNYIGQFVSILKNKIQGNAVISFNE